MKTKEVRERTMWVSGERVFQVKCMVSQKPEELHWYLKWYL